LISWENVFYNVVILYDVINRKVHF